MRKQRPRHPASHPKNLFLASHNTHITSPRFGINITTTIYNCFPSHAHFDDSRSCHIRYFKKTFHYSLCADSYVALRRVVFALSRRRVHASSLIHRSSSDKLIQIILTVLRVRVRHVFEVSRHRRFRVRRLLSVKQTREKAPFVLLSHQLID